MARIMFPTDFKEAFEDKTGQSFDEDSARAIIELLDQTAGGRSLMAHVLLPHFMEFLESERTKPPEYPLSPRITLWLPSTPIFQGSPS